MNIIKKLILSPLFFVLLSNNVYAHCPLCTLGIVAAAGGATWLGVNQVVIGLFVGGFAISIGWWVSRLIKRTYFPFQKSAIILASFILTVIPLLPFMNGFYPLYISFFGDYGSLFNRTYLVDTFLIGSVLGGIIVSIGPWLSNQITRLRNNKIIPFQGVILTLLLLIIVGGLIELLI